MGVVAAELKIAIQGLNEVTRGILSDNGLENIEDTIKGYAVFAAVAGLASGWVPGAGGIIAAASYTALVWAMYVNINKELGISIKENVGKSLASAIITNVIAAAGSLILGLAGAVLLSFIPGFGTAGAMAIDGFIGYVVVFASGIVYIKLLTSLYEKKLDIANLTEEKCKNLAKEAVEETNMKSVIQEAKTAYKHDKNSGKFK